MFGITDISAGWLVLSLYHGGWKPLTFDVSYLSDFKKEMDYLLNIPDYDDTDIRRVYLDGEGIDLYLTAWRQPFGEKMYLVWEQYGVRTNKGVKDKTIIKTMVFNYNKFVNHFNRIFDNIKDTYYTDFDMDSMDKMEDAQCKIN